MCKFSRRKVGKDQQIKRWLWMRTDERRESGGAENERSEERVKQPRDFEWDRGKSHETTEQLEVVRPKHRRKTRKRFRLADGSNLELDLTRLDLDACHVPLPISSTSPSSSSLHSRRPLSAEQERERVNLYAITGAFIHDAEGNRVLSNNHCQENAPSFSKGLANTREKNTRERSTANDQNNPEVRLRLPSLYLQLVSFENRQTNFVARFPNLTVTFSGSTLRRMGDVVLYDSYLSIHDHHPRPHPIANQGENEPATSTVLRRGSRTLPEPGGEAAGLGESWFRSVVLR